MKYEIIAEYKRIPKKESFGKFNNLKDCLNHMDFLKRSNLSDTLKFKVKEVN